MASGHLERIPWPEVEDYLRERVVCEQGHDTTGFTDDFADGFAAALHLLYKIEDDVPALQVGEDLVIFETRVREILRAAHEDV